MQDTPANPARFGRRNIYGQRRGARLRKSHREYLREDLATLTPAGVSPKENPERHPLDLPRLFGRDCEVWLEVGFGSGEHLAYQAAKHPEVGFLGCEPYFKGVAKLIGQAKDQDLTNIRIYAGDVRDLFDVLPPASLFRAYALYPDPWPKKRHHKRRFVTPEFLDPLARAMEPGAELRLATDIADFARQAVEQIQAHPGFNWIAGRSRDWKQPWDDWLPTKYEKKALREGRVPIYLTIKRV